MHPDLEQIETIVKRLKGTGMTDMRVSPLATPKEVADYLHTNTASLSQQRYKGTGIPFVKVDGRRVLYRLADVEAYIESRVMTRTDERPSAT